ncbi:hypothetical protein CC117_24385 [Parafrankia colletiae]|uniref:Uncharacterized protein n=1 Tax=Parafrankia colletiae TaxID=573497 RepID=A0A1S1QFD1_9ACTN|nr:hypothetical protein [Parafrankia colletiae]MCK9901678.1 hypothetical protein [Frankia sp. Cpl3]OHV32690.1 hypothetical protein CC117_24385 [Parafrankia colletiae]
MPLSEVLHQFGDPDLAVAAADQAIRAFLRNSAAINRTPAHVARHVPAFRKAVLISADIHARFGRDDIAAAAQALSAVTTLYGATPDQ